MSRARDYGITRARILLRDVRWVPAAGLNLAHDHDQALIDIAAAIAAAFVEGRESGAESRGARSHPPNNDATEPE